MAAAFIPLNIPAHYFNQAVIRGLIFPLLWAQEAMSLTAAIGLPLPRTQYVPDRCILDYQSGAPPFQAINGPGAAPFGWNGVPTALVSHVTQVPTLNPIVRVGPLVCNRRAVFVNTATGLVEPSFCVENPAQPVSTVVGLPPFPPHLRPHPLGLLLVCPTCKQDRGMDFRHRRNRLKFGVCPPCQTWALQRLRPGEDDCVCNPAGRYVNGENSNGIKRQYLCHNHFVNSWDDISARADLEMIHRFWRQRTRAQKRRGHGWTRRKNDRPPTRTPRQRRNAVRDTTPVGMAGLPLNPVPGQMPVCYCGGAIRPADRNWNHNPNHIRNCIGCNRFMRM